MEIKELQITNWELYIIHTALLEILWDRQKSEYPDTNEIKKIKELLKRTNQ